MKKTLLIILSCVLVMSLLCGCGPSPEENIAKGDAAMSSGDLTEALDYYKSAGPAGDEKEKQVLERIVLNLMNKKTTIGSNTNFHVYNLEDVLEYLEEHAKYTFSDEAERNAFLLRCATIYVEESLQEAPIDDTNIKRFLYAVTNKIPAETPGMEDFLNNSYYTLGYQLLMDDVDSNPSHFTGWFDALYYWQNCTAGPGYECYQAEDVTIPGGNYAEGLSVLAKYITSTKAMAMVCSEMKSRIEFDSLSEMFAYEAAYNAINPREDTGATLTKSFDSAYDIMLGDVHPNDSVTVKIAEVEAACGQSPDGRILFLHKPNAYDGTVSVYLPLMDRLPNAYYPESLESVEFVILTVCDTVKTGGIFGNVTEELREDTTLRLYDVKTGEILYEATTEGPTSYMMTYVGEPPAVYSAGAPNMAPEVRAAVAVIENLMKQ